MNEEEFASPKYGRLDHESEGLYYRFEPNALPFDYEPSQKTNILTDQANRVLGRLNGRTERFHPDQVSLLKIPFLLKEAQSSSRIEGTRSTLTDIFKEEKIGETNSAKRIDNEEVRNNEEALKTGLTKNITEKTICELHKILLRGVRGATKHPGEYKHHQNAIGNYGDHLDAAKFVPASPKTTPRLMKNLVEYIHAEPNIIPLQKIAVVHYQFESIHPFMDGNGRIGRLLVLLQLCKEGYLDHPLLYLSQYFNTNRDMYTKRLYEVSTQNNMDEWVQFFLNGVIKQVRSSLELIEKIETYKENAITAVRKIYDSSKIRRVVELLIRNPIIRVKDVQKHTTFKSRQGANSLVKKFEEAQILTEITGKQSHKIYVAKDLLKLLEDEKGAIQELL